MKIHLEADYTSHVVFYPAYCLSGRLMAASLQFHFPHISANVVMPQSLMLPLLSEEQRLNLLLHKLNIAERNKAFFCQHQVNLTIPVDEWLAQKILDSEFLQHKLAALPMLQLEISEEFSGINLGCRDPLLNQLATTFRLCLSNYGAGKANSKAVLDGLFHQITLDGHFIRQQMEKSTFATFMKVMTENLRASSAVILVQGIDSPQALETIARFDLDGVSSGLFRAVSEQELPDLIQTPPVLSVR